MKAIVHGFHTEIFPTTEEVRELCRPGEGANTCIFLLIGEQWECYYHNRQPVMGLLERARRGETSAQREGCDRVKNWEPLWNQLGELEIPSPEVPA